MAFTAYPFDGVEVTEAQYGRLFREFQTSGVIDTYDGGEFVVTAPALGLTVNLSPGSAIVRGHAVLSDAPEVLTVAAPHASLTRWDQAVLELNPVTNSILPKVLTGVPGSGVPAAVTQSETGIFHLQLARIRVQAGAVSITPDDITDRRRFVANSVGTWSDDTRPAGSSRRVGMLGYNTGLGAFEFWSGTGWQKLQPTTTWASITGKPSQFNPTPHGHSWSEISGKPTQMRPLWHDHPWSEITGKPSTFPPGIHTHSWSAVTGKPTQFTPAPHTHTWLDIKNPPGWMHTAEDTFQKIDSDIDMLKMRSTATTTLQETVRQLQTEVAALRNRVTNLEK